MATFTRSEHYRTNAYGTTFRVREHTVRRDHWNAEWIAQLHGSPAYKAADLLRRSHVGRGAQGCFVVPNAKCPVCGVPVFFYANSFGSSVYFDDLGPPWPKHPCTDNPRPRRPIIHEAWKPITRRKAGEIRELIGAANTLGLLQNKQFGVRAGGEWSLIVIDEIARSGDRNDAKCTLIDSGEGKRVEFYCFSNEALFEPGDMIGIAGSEFSFVLRSNLAEIRFRTGDRVTLTGGSARVERGTVATPVLPRPVAKAASRFDPSLYGKAGWSDTLKRHYQAKNLAKEDFLKLATKPVTSQLRRGARTPDQFADGLNGIGFRTAAGEVWTPLLARFLIRFIYEQQRAAYQEKKRALMKKRLGRRKAKKPKARNMR